MEPKTPEALRAIGYVRVSTGEQAASGLGLEAQRAAILAFAKRMGFNVEKIFVDAGRSGDLPVAERPGLYASLQALRPHNALVVARRDRLGRDPVDLALIDRRAKKNKVSVLSAAGEGTYDDSPDSVFMRRIVDAMAERELSMIRHRTKAALRAKRMRNEVVGSTPFGFSKGPDGKLVRNDREQRVIQKTLKLYDQGHSHREIVQILKVEGVVSPRTGAALHLMQVQRLLWRYKRKGPRKQPHG